AKETRFREALYGSGTKEANRAQDYTDNKLHELYARMGNSILKDISACRSEQEAVSQTHRQPSVANHLNGLQKIFNADIKAQRLAKREYQKRQADQERDREKDKKKQEQQTRFY
ncbi:relaxase MobL, partial [Lacticaseibacillus paracasei]